MQRRDLKIIQNENMNFFLELENEKPGFSL